MKAHIPRKLSSNERKTLMHEANRQCIEFEKAHEAELVCRSLWILYSVFGWGEKRLTRFYEAYHREIAELVKHYELDPADDCWLCMKKLHDAGFTFEEDEDDSQRISEKI